MKTHPNQRVYRVTKTSRLNAPKVVIDKVDLKVAYRVLNKSELLIWLDMMGNIADQTHAFSPEFYHKHYGMARNTAREAFNSLIEKGFLVIVKEGSNAYRVYSQTSNPKFDEIYDEVEKITQHNEQEEIVW